MKNIFTTLSLTMLLLISGSTFSQVYIFDVGMDTTTAKYVNIHNKVGCTPNTTTVLCDVPFVFDLTNSGYTGDLSPQNDLDCDGDQDVGFSVENSVWFEWCNPISLPITVTVGFDEPGTGSSCNIQGAVWIGPSMSTATINSGTVDEYGSNPGGNADGFSFTITVPVGECAYFMVDGYAGGLCNGVSAVVPCPAALPIELISFEGYNEDNVNKLNWVTATEINNDYFTLEKSVDGNVWEEVGTVEGSGNSNTPIMYELNDDSYTSGVNYYRLTQTDFDGKSETFKLVVIKNTKLELELYGVRDIYGRELEIDKEKNGEYDSKIRILIYFDGINYTYDKIR